MDGYKDIVDKLIKMELRNDAQHNEMGDRMKRIETQFDKLTEMIINDQKLLAELHGSYRVSRWLVNMFWTAFGALTAWVVK